MILVEFLSQSAYARAMAISVILLVAVIVIVIIKIIELSYKRYHLVKIVDKIPGPKAYPIVGNALQYTLVPRKERDIWYRNLCSQYKDGIFRLWMGLTPDIHLISPDTAGIIMRSKDLITKSLNYDFFHPWIGTGLLTSTGDKWHRQRKFITPAFHFNILEQFSVIMSEKAEILKQCITSQLKKDPTKPLDMFVLMTRCALDVICESAMGININAQTKEGIEYVNALKSITEQVNARMFRPWLHKDWIYHHSSRGKEYKNSVEIAHRFTEKVINERKLARKNKKQGSDNDKPRRQAFLDHLLDACERDNTTLTDEEFREEVDTFMFGGHDTTATAMSWVLFCLGNHPDIQEKVHEEQLLVFGDSTEPATFQQLGELKYLDRVIKESLRIFPSGPTLSRKATEDVEIAGYTIPKDSIISMQLHMIHRDPKHWPDPERFDPDRFLPENSYNRHPFAFVPFSAGPRNCIGQKFALLEEKIVLTAVLRSWRVKSLVKWGKIKCYNEIILRPQDGIMIHFTPK